MFKSLKLKQFGEHLKQIRLSSGLTQADVGNQARLSRDTIRRIEIGEVVVRFDTLVLLSEIYKRDLLEDLRYFSDSTVLFTYYHRLDELISNNDVDTLRQLREDFVAFSQQYEFDYPIVVQIKQQFELFLDAITALNSESYDTAVDCLIKAMKVTNPAFELEQLLAARYSLFEQRILIVLAQAISRQKDYLLSNQILNFLHGKLIKVSGSSINEMQLIIKILGNLADNYHLMENDKQVKRVAQRGIDYCNENHLIYGLSIFLYRLGIAKFHLKESDYLTPLRQAIVILQVQGMTDLADYYLIITAERYQIKIFD